jgi:Holliday junction resolvase RusA-like endonuclease
MQTDIITYVIPGNPMPLARARYGKNKIWDSQKQQKFAFGLHLSSQHQNRPLYFGPLLFEVIFFMKIPDSQKRKITTDNRPHIYVPDLSNLIKFVEDAATGVLFHDDCIISNINAKKIYDITDMPRTEFRIIELRHIKKVDPVHHESFSFWR